jgi:hypothetical protein
MDVYQLLLNRRLGWPDRIRGGWVTFFWPAGWQSRPALGPSWIVWHTPSHPPVWSSRHGQRGIWLFERDRIAVIHEPLFPFPLPLPPNVSLTLLVVRQRLYSHPSRSPAQAPIELHVTSAQPFLVFRAGEQFVQDAICLHVQMRGNVPIRHEARLIYSIVSRLRPMVDCVKNEPGFVTSSLHHAAEDNPQPTSVHDDSQKVAAVPAYPF